MRMLLSQTGKETFGGIDFAILFLVAILVGDRFSIQRPDFVGVGFDECGSHHRVIEMHLSSFITPLQTSWTVESLGMEVVGAIKSGDIKGRCLSSAAHRTLIVVSPTSASHLLKEDGQKSSNGGAVSGINNVAQLSLRGELPNPKNGFEVASSTSLFHGNLELQ